MSLIRDNYLNLRRSVPSQVTIVVAAKQRTPEEIKEVIASGASDIGENYVQDAQKIKEALGAEYAKKVRWHMIGDLQTNKINKAIGLFDVIQTVDSVEKVEALDLRLGNINKSKFPVLIEVNSANESAKSGAKPDIKSIEGIAIKISVAKNIKLKGLMTMGPFDKSGDELRPYFKLTKNFFDLLKRQKMPNVEIEILSMGMSGSYKQAIDEGANMIRIGTNIFGSR